MHSGNNILKYFVMPCHNINDMRRKTSFIAIAIVINISLLLGVTSCKKNHPAKCYKGEVVYRKECGYLIQIKNTIEKGLSEGTLLSFDLNGVKSQLKDKDVIYFTIKNYSAILPGGWTDCIRPQYYASITNCKQ